MGGINRRIKVQAGLKNPEKTYPKMSKTKMARGLAWL
jgi:hypothetical protein